MRLTFLPVRRRTLSFALYALAAGLLAGSLALATSLQSARAGDGTDWGPSGALAATSSAVTVSWDNSGDTPAADRVPRDSSQVLPHTGGKTYSDVDPALSSAVHQAYANAKLTISQTTGLQHQAVNLTLSGVDIGSATNPIPGLWIMQCWGSADEADPDPEHCEDGQGTVDTSSTNTQTSGAIATPDQRLTGGGDLKAFTSVFLRAVMQDGGSSAELQATVVSSTIGAATGAAGKVEFDNSDGTAVATVPVVGGQATTTVTGLVAGSSSSFTGHYIAAATENYTSSPDSLPLALPAGASASLPAPPESGVGANDNPNQTPYVPFLGVDGSNGSVLTTQYFSATTTNEINDLTNGSRPFEVLTGAQSAGLGCGFRTDQPSTSVCWLVAVPSNLGTLPSGYNGAVSPLTPSLWAQRLQVKLDFADVAPSCGAGARELSIGSELLVDAMNSWIPQMCNQIGVDLGYIQIDDESARDTYSTGNASLVFTSQPIDDDSGGTSTLYAPAGLAAVTISVLSAKAVGAGVTGFQTLTGIKLNARLVVKLLTESYQNGIDGFGHSNVQAALPWQSKLPLNLANDREFLALNPGLPRSVLSGSDLIVTVAGSDATSALWNWITADPDAKAFLDGCPDTASTVAGAASVINPFYSTRTYTECPDSKDGLEATAAAERAMQSPSNPTGTQLPSTYTDATPSYPPAGGVFPQPGYYERPAVIDGQGNVSQTPDTLADLHPRENTLSAVATDVFRGQEKTLNTFCSTNLACPGTVVTPPGVWINSTQPIQGSGYFGLTDGTAAARNLLPTVALCDDSGQNCVGANNDSLAKAAARFAISGSDSHFRALDQADFAKNDEYSSGAYPLTIPVYAEINTKDLAAADAASYAKVLQYIATAGQQQGFAIGSLPPGMTPLDDSLLAQDNAAIATLTQIASPPDGAAPSDAPAPPDGQPQGPDEASGPGQPGGDVPPMSFVPVDGPPAADAPVGSGPSPSPTSTPQAEPGPTAITPALATGPYAYGAGAGLLGALAAGIAAPIVGRKRRG